MVARHMWRIGNLQEKVTVYCDNQSTIHLTKHQVFHKRFKHIDVKIYFVRDVIAQRLVKVEKIPTEEFPTDMFTKALPVTKFRHCLDLVNFCEE